MTHDLETTRAAAQLLTEFGDVQSAERAAAARVQTACNAVERAFWSRVRACVAREPGQARDATATG
ncbi:MAG: hypothetical protein JWL60_1056 [Gemmatimonadetes bacterium]|jgi:hypothetical protein|nr:hypothetical protein [Gemmatimonadota bacterium]